MAADFTDNERQLLLGLLEIGARSKDRAAFASAMPNGFSSATFLTLERRGFAARLVGRRHEMDQLYLTAEGEAEARQLVRVLGVAWVIRSVREFLAAGATTRSAEWIDERGRAVPGPEDGAYLRLQLNVALGIRTFMLSPAELAQIGEIHDQTPVA